MGTKTIIKTSCGICSPQCKIDACVENGKIVSVEGSSIHGKPGKLCSKGAASRQYVYNKERILYPMRRTGKKGEGKFERITWEEAYEMIAENLLRIREQYGAKSVIFYAGYPKWYRPALLRLANDYGSPNFCTESSTCFQAAALAWKSMYGNRICFPDLMNARTLLLWSSNLYHSNAVMSGLYQGIKKRGTHIIAVDPKNTVTAHDAKIHLPLIPGTDGALALAMGRVIVNEGLYDKAFVEKYVYGFEEYREYVQEFTPERAQEITGVEADLIVKAARIYATEKPAGIMFSASPVVHNINGVQNYRAVFALAAITGNYDVKGGNPSRGGITVPLNEFGRVHRYDQEEAVGEKDFPAWFDLPCDEAQCTRLADYIMKEDPYPLKAMFAMGFNRRMWPEPSYLGKAVEKLDFFVNTDLFWSDSCDAADLVLPACTSFERDEVRADKGGMVFLSRKAVEPLGEAKSDIEIILETAKRMGAKDEILQLNSEEYMEYVLKPSGVTLEELRKSETGLVKAPRVIPPKERVYEEEPFDTPSGKIELKSQVFERHREDYGYEGLPVYHDFREMKRAEREGFPLILSTGSRKPQLFHSRMYRMSWLSGLEKTPLVELHPEDAKRYGIEEGGMVKVTSPAGSVTGTAAFCISGHPGVVSMYHGSKDGEANELISKDYLDPYSGFPGYKSYFCRIEPARELL